MDWEWERDVDIDVEGVGERKEEVVGVGDRG